MGIERERKFLVTGDGWRRAGQPTRIRQGYLCATVSCSVRVRNLGRAGFPDSQGQGRK